MILLYQMTKSTKLWMLSKKMKNMIACEVTDVFSSYILLKIGGGGMLSQQRL